MKDYSGILNGNYAYLCCRIIFLDNMKNSNKIVTVEEGSLIGGMGETVKSILSGTDAKIYSIGLPDKFIEHGKQSLIREKYGFSVENIEAQILKLLDK